MGVLTKRISNSCLTCCGSAFICCPALRARSRVPVKRYRLLLKDIFPKNPDEPPNDRKIGKLAEYAAKNPNRVPKIANALEQRGKKELHAGQYGYVVIVMKAYSKLFFSCQEQMSLFATKALNMIQELLNSGHMDMRILACNTLVDFVHAQVDAAYMHALEEMVLVMCLIARQSGPSAKDRELRAAGLHCLAEMVSYMGERSHISQNFDEIVKAMLDNYKVSISEVDVSIDMVAEIHRTGTPLHPSAGQRTQSPHNNHLRSKSFSIAVDGVGGIVRGAMEKLLMNKDQQKVEPGTPEAYALHCLQNMARLAKEVTTAKRILDPVFRYFDDNEHWVKNRRLPVEVMWDMLEVMEKTGRSELLRAASVRHLESRNVVENPVIKVVIVKTIGSLVKKSKMKGSITEVAVMQDLARHLRRSMEQSEKFLEHGRRSEASREEIEEELELQSCIEDCLAELAKKIGDPLPVLDMIAAVLEKLSGPAMTTRTTLQAMEVVAKSVAEMPQTTNNAPQQFPEAVFQQLLQVLAYPDPETRCGGHRIFAILLPAIPSSSTFKPQGAVASAMAQAKARFERLIGRDKRVEEEGAETGRSKEEEAAHMAAGGETITAVLNTGHSRVRSRSYRQLGVVIGNKGGRAGRGAANNSVGGGGGEGMTGLGGLSGVHFSGHQASLLLSSLWYQSSMPDNLPVNYEWMAYTYSLVVQYSKPKTTAHTPMLRAIQVALSIRCIALRSETALPPVRRRSLLMLGTAMFMTAAKMYGFPQVSAYAKDIITDDTKCPFLEFTVEDRLQVVGGALASTVTEAEYSSQTNNDAAARALSSSSVIHASEDLALLVDKICSTPGLVESEGPEFRIKLVEPFIPDDSFALRPRRFMQASNPASPSLRPDVPDVELADPIVNNRPISDTRQDSDIPVQSVEELVQQSEESARAEERAVSSIPRRPLPFNVITNQAQAVSVTARQKLKLILNKDAMSPSVSPMASPTIAGAMHSSYFTEGRGETGDKGLDKGSGVRYPSPPTSRSPELTAIATAESWPAGLKLPPHSQYDAFLKAAGHS